MPREAFSSILSAPWPHKYRPGQKVQQINLKDPNRSTTTWNPTNRLRTRADALEIAHAVVSNADTGLQTTGGGNNELFWINSSINLLADTLLTLHDNPKETTSWPCSRNRQHEH